MNFLKSLFGFDSVVNSATKIVDKLAGTDWTGKEKADWIIQYMGATKHQSPARRFIAILLTIAWAILFLSWLIARLCGQMLDLQSATNVANAIKVFMSDTIKEPFNYVIMFYFAVAALNKFSK